MNTQSNRHNIFRRRVLAGILVLLFILPMLACGGSGSSQAPRATATPLPMTSMWSKIVAAYAPMGPNEKPDKLIMLRSLTEVMTAANEIVGDRRFSSEDVRHAQDIFDAAADAHDSLAEGDVDTASAYLTMLYLYVEALINAGF